MKATFRMWKYSRMVVLVAVVAAMYAAAITILITPPPFTTYLVAQLLPIPLSLMFGPAVPWGLGIGQVVGAFATGTIEIGNLVGFGGNFIYGLIPYAAWTRLRPLGTGPEIDLKQPRQIVKYVVIVLGAAFATAVFTAWPLHLLGTAAFPFLVPLIAVQDFILGLLAVVLLVLLYSRVRSIGLLYWQVMDERDWRATSPTIGAAGAWLAIVISVASGVLGAFLLPGLATEFGAIGFGGLILAVVLLW